MRSNITDFDNRITMNIKVTTGLGDHLNEIGRFQLKVKG